MVRCAFIWVGLLLMCCLFPLLLPAQKATRALGDYVKHINRFGALNPQEKVWLHFDNTGYYIGETMWFAAYVVFAADHSADTLSKVLYVDLLNPQGLLVDSRKLKIMNGRCHGEFRLPHEYRSGFYEVRAYTRSMLNFGEDCMFSRVFPVYSDPEVAGDYGEKKMDAADLLWNLRQKEEKRDQMNVSFYPEGGYAVMGLPSRIAFRVTGKDGEELEACGRVCDASGKTVASFRTEHQGMGTFELIPKAQNYRVEIESGGRKRSFPFLDIASSAYVLRVDDYGADTIGVTVAKSPDLPYDTLGVSVSCRGRVYTVEAFAAGEEPYSFRLPLKGLPSGCLQFTLFDKYGRALAERLFFHRGNVDCIRVSAKASKSVYKPLERVEMDLVSVDTSGSPVPACFSLSVRDAGTEVFTDYAGNILTDLLLASDVKGYIANPMQYFTNNDSVTRRRLDLLMLVQGWSRYDWSIMAGVEPFEVLYYAEEGLDLSGRVLDYSKEKFLPGVKITYLLSKDSVSFHGHTQTDAEGRFHFTLPEKADIYGKWNLGLYVTSRNKRRHCRILLDRGGPLGRAYTYHDVAVRDSTVVFEEVADSVQRSVREMQYIDEVVVKRPGKVKPDIVLDVERDVNRCRDRGEEYPLTLAEYLENRVSVIQDEQFAGHRIYRCYRCKVETRNRLLVNRLPMSSWEIEKVSHIEIYYKNKFAWRQVADRDCLLHAPHEPAVFILVKVYDDYLRDGYQKGIRQTFYNGWAKSKQFYHTDNSRKLPGEADFRRTLYWNPGVKIDGSGRGSIRFYNNSSCRKMTVSVNGMTREGRFVIY